MRNFYRYLINPLFLFGVNILALFNHSIRDGIRNRRQVIPKLLKWLGNKENSEKRVLFHTASLGEFEHIKPLLVEMKKRYHTQNIVTFFSPSGYDHARLDEGMDYKSYVPMESYNSWMEFYQKLRPVILIIAKHDVWPAQVWCAELLNIPVCLINGSLPVSSSRINGLARNFLRSVYSSIDKIYAISDEDTRRFRKIYCLDNVEYLGDTKYDQVVYRKKAAQRQNLLPDQWIKTCNIIVAGSIWPEDATHLFPSFKRLLDLNPQWNIIIVPHQPTSDFVRKIEEEFQKWGTIRFSGKDQMNRQRTIIVDEIGHLAGLYIYANIAYVGGSFKQGIHNAMEPAIYGIPVIYGPVHENSYEAIRLAECGGGRVIKNSQDMDKLLDRFTMHEEERNKIGCQALQFAQKHTGATEKLLNSWQDILGEDIENSTF